MSEGRAKEIDSSAVMSNCCNPRGPEFDSQHLRHSSQPSVTLIPGNLEELLIHGKPCREKHIKINKWLKDYSL